MIVNARFLTQRMTGVQRYAAEIAKRLRKRMPHVRFVTPRNIIHTGLADELGAEAFGSTTGHVWEQVELPRFMRRQPDSPLLVSLANTGPVRYENQIVVIHDISTIRHPESYSRRFGALYRYLLPRLARNSAGVITDSEFSRQEIVQEFGLSDGRVRVVHAGVDQMFCPTEQVSKETSPYILAVSSLAPHKNLSRLIEAFSYLDIGAVKLKIVGAKASSFSSMRIDATLMKNIEFTGYVSDAELVRLYQNATLFVFPSLYEGFGLPPLEAMACGCPCVVSAAASLPEVCADAAQYVDPTDAFDMASRIQQVWDDEKLRDTLKQRGRRRVMEFSWCSASEKMAESLGHFSGRVPA